MKDKILQLLRREIDWHDENYSNGAMKELSDEFKDGFLKGLEHIDSLIEQIDYKDNS